MVKIKMIGKETYLEELRKLKKLTEFFNSLDFKDCFFKTKIEKEIEYQHTYFFSKYCEIVGKESFDNEFMENVES